MSDKYNIPENFYKGDNQPNPMNVGELKMALSLLPDNLMIEQGFGYGTKLVVFNVDTNPHLSFEEAD